jgi:hypothetical protein
VALAPESIDPNCNSSLQTTAKVAGNRLHLLSDTMDTMSNGVQALIDEFAADAVISGSELAERATSYWDSSPTKAKALLRLTSTEQVSRAMRICAEQKQTVVVQGGLTGVVAGAVSSADDIIISLERMHQIESVDAMDGVAIGVPL